MALYYFPTHLLHPETVRAGVQAREISGGVALSGDETIIQTDGGGRVEITYTDIDLDDPEVRRIWDVWQDYLSGGTPVLVPVCSLELAPIPAGASPASFAGDDPYFPTSVGFSPPYIIAETVGAAAIRDTSITLEVTQGDPPKPATWFCVGSRSYRIRRVLAVVGDEYTVEFSPPLREAIPDGTPVNFDWACVQCRAVTGQDLIPSIMQGKFATVSISFFEDFSVVPA
jgi:hypothetical protein